MQATGPEVAACFEASFAGLASCREMGAGRMTGRWLVSKLEMSVYAFQSLRGLDIPCGDIGLG